MSVRIDYHQVAPGAVRAMLGLEQYLAGQKGEEGLPPSLLELVKIRVSQLNGCAYCLDMHTKDARAAGESEQRLYLLGTWEEAPCFDPREKAALAWAEGLTLQAQNGVTEALFRRTRQQFSERQLADLTLAIVAINGWNRFAVALGAEVGSYRAGQQVTA
ncbi:carboxymuconolactone decarboxylase family protein [Zobellella sp. An-6]|uniref:carboxymuconolactone decarboxylase family protein n=1 Tax=Zobellella sp. An-6 TaxID=3400218 RepID=UPI0040433E99